MRMIQKTAVAMIVGLACAGAAFADGQTVSGGGGGKDSAQTGQTTSVIVSSNPTASLPPAVPTAPGARRGDALPSLTINLRPPSTSILGAADARRIDVQRVNLAPPPESGAPTGPDLGPTEFELRRALPPLPGTVVGAGNSLVLVYIDPTSGGAGGTGTGGALSGGGLAGGLSDGGGTALGDGNGGGYVLANPDGSVPQGLGAVSNLGGNSPSVNGLLLSHALR